MKKHMETSRRELIGAGVMLGTLAATASDAAGHGAPLAAAPGLMEVLHIYAGPDGLSRARRVKVYGNRELPATHILAGSIGPGLLDWGTSARKRFSINLVGDLDVELGDGSHHRIGKGDLVFIDDQGGNLGPKGHRTHILTPVANLFVEVSDDFDLEAWAGKPA